MNRLDFFVISFIYTAEEYSSVSFKQLLSGLLAGYKKQQSLCFILKEEICFDDS